MTHFNKLLEKQIRKHIADSTVFSEEQMNLLHSINRSYQHFEQNRDLLERAMNLSSLEIREYYKKLEVQKELELSNKYLEQFASIASHDLKAPLRTIGSFSQLLSNKLQGQLDEEAEQYIDFIVSGVHRMQTLIEDLMTFAKIGSTEEDKKPIDLNSILEVVKLNLKSTIEESSAQLIVEKQLPTFTAMRFQVLQLFQNIIGNALKFRSEESPIIHINYEEKGNKYVISIQDNGLGMDQSLHSLAFETFSRLNPKVKVAGSGLGLSICKKIVEGWKGKIWFESELGKGTTFFFTIPIDKSLELSKNFTPMERARKLA